MTAQAPQFGAHGTSSARMFADLGAGASAGRLPDGRLFLQHGPINLVIGIDGQPTAIARAEAELLQCFPHWLGQLVAVLPRLRQPASDALTLPDDPIATRMCEAVAPFASGYITPMAAVAGAIADAALNVIAVIDGIDKAYVNNGGDIALHLAEPATFRVGIVADASAGHVGGQVDIEAASAVRGIATSGWRGRSHSLGIADGVTVLARTAAAADAAATAIASATNTQHHAIERAPANVLDENSDLGAQPVTVAVGTLDDAACADALANGLQLARQTVDAGHIHAVALCVQGRWQFAGDALAQAVSTPRLPCAAPRTQPLRCQPLRDGGIEVKNQERLS